MNRLARWVMRLYPARWRRRYGEEVDALLADSGADARAVTNLAAGGVRMQFSTWSFPKLALVLGLAGTLAGLGASFLIAPIYRSTATLQMTAAGDEPSSPQLATNLNATIQQLQVNVFSRTTLSGIFNDPRLKIYTDLAKVTPLEDIIEKMRSDSRVQFVSQPGQRVSVFTVAFQYPDREKAQRTTEALIAAFMAQHQQTAKYFPAYRDKHYLLVIDPASLPVLPVFPNVDLVRLAGFSLGALLVWIVRKIRKAKFVAWRYVTATVIFGLLGMLAADLAYIEDLLGNRYVSTATLHLQNGTAEQIEALQQQVFSRTSLSAVINDPRLRLYKDDLKTQPLEDVIQTMRHNISLSVAGGANQSDFRLSFLYYDRYKAQQTTTTLIARFEEANHDLFRGAIAANPEGLTRSGILAVLDPASLPVAPISPNRYVMTGLGFLAGLVLAIVTALIRRRWKPEPEIPVDVVNV